MRTRSFNRSARIGPAPTGIRSRKHTMNTIKALRTAFASRPKEWPLHRWLPPEVLLVIAIGVFPSGGGIASAAPAPKPSNSITINAGTGLSGGGTVVLGGSTTLNNAGVLAVNGNADIQATTVNGVVTLGDTATSANTPNTIVKRDSSGDFLANSITLNGALNLPATTSSRDIIYSGSALLLYGDNNGNFFSGQNAGNLTMSGGYNTADGCNALTANTSGNNNTANGANALWNNTSGVWNTASGAWALAGNTAGGGNTAAGYAALTANTDGNENTAAGSLALGANTGGNNNTAAGSQALGRNTSGNNNTANGAFALLLNTSGVDNTAIGLGALGNNPSGNNNIALGSRAGGNLQGGDNNIYIGNPGEIITESGAMHIGTPGTQTSTFIAGIAGATVSSGTAVYVNSFGQLGTLTSSRRFKQGIQDMGNNSDVLLALRPVMFRYKPELDAKGIPQFGLVAEEVEQVDPDLVVRDAKGEVSSVRYEQVNAMLLNEFLKEHRKVEQLESRLEKLEQLLNAKNRGEQ
jgi:hypothetical protein